MPSYKLSTDWWAVLLALFTAAVIRLGFFPHVSW